jgi:hypothetical protein
MQLVGFSRTEILDFQQISCLCKGPYALSSHRTTPNNGYSSNFRPIPSRTLVYPQEEKQKKGQKSLGDL